MFGEGTCDLKEGSVTDHFKITNVVKLYRINNNRNQERKT